jgi:hypothetical protein
VLSLFPTRAFYALSAMSERALAYSDEPLSHRVLVIQEAAALQSELGTYLLRSLLSEGHLRYETVEKTKEGMRPRMLERAGPTGLLITTTQVRLHPENETRILSIPVNDTAEQTRRIMIATARGPKEHAVDLDRWHALQTWLEGREHGVEVPFAEELAMRVPTSSVRLRRDFRSVLNLIRAHALLHQATRQKDPQRRVIANLVDYEAVRTLVDDLIADGVEATGRPRLRETVQVVAGIAPGEVTINEIARQLKLDKSSASRRVGECISRGYLQNRETRPGQPARVMIGDPMPEKGSVLPAVEELTRDPRCTVACDSKGINGPPDPTDKPVRGAGDAPACESHAVGPPLTQLPLMQSTADLKCPNDPDHPLLTVRGVTTCRSCHMVLRGDLDAALANGVRVRSGVAHDDEDMDEGRLNQRKEIAHGN